MWMADCVNSRFVKGSMDGLRPIWINIIFRTFCVISSCFVCLQGRNHEIHSQLTAPQLLNLCVPVHVAIASPRSKLGTHHFLVHASWGQDRSCLRYAAAWLGNIGIVTPQKKGGQRGPLNFRVGSNPKGFTFYNCITHIATSYRHTPCTRSTRYMRVRVGAWNNSTLGYQHSCRSFRIFDFRPVWTLWSGG